MKPDEAGASDGASQVIPVFGGLQSVSEAGMSVSTPTDPDAIKRQRILDEWKINVDLHKFHDGLKHQRITHTLTVQTALFGLCGILAREYFVDGGASRWPLSLVILVLATLGCHLADTYASMDRRARLYVDIVKGRLLLLEEESKAAFSPDPGLSTYGEQWRLARQDDLTTQKYTAIRALGVQEQLPRFLLEPPAFQNEQNLFKLFQNTWVTVMAL